MKKRGSAYLAGFLIMILVLPALSARAETETIPGWAADSPALLSILDYVKSVTDTASPDYVPPEERIVLFDMDGTLTGERYPTYTDESMLVYRLLHDDAAASDGDKAWARAMVDAWTNHQGLPSSPRSGSQMTAESFKGFTVEEYRAYIRDFLVQPVPGFSGMTYAQRFFVPMVELVRHLAEHDFIIFISSGTERTLSREIIAGTLGAWVPPYQVIGTTFSLTASGQGTTDGRKYTYAADDQVLLEGNMIVKNQKMNKVFTIIDEIGADPILVFGNTSGDFAMAQYALQHGGKAYMLLCDDTLRDYGDPDVAAAFAAECEKLGFETVSMRDEFEVIYPDNVGITREDATEPAA